MSVGIDQSKFVLSGSLWSSRPTVYIKYRIISTLEFENYSLLCVSCHENRTANKDNSYKLGALGRIEIILNFVIRQETIKLLLSYFQWEVVTFSQHQICCVKIVL